MLPGLRGVVVVIAVESDQGGLLGKLVQAMGVGEGNEFVMLAVEKKDGDVQLRYGVVGAEGVTDEEGRGEVATGHGGHAGEGAFEDHGGGLMACGQISGDGSAKRATKVDDALGVDVGNIEGLLEEPVGIVGDDGLTGMAVGAAVAAIFDEQDAQTQGLKAHGVKMKVGDGFTVAMQVNKERAGGTGGTGGTDGGGRRWEVPGFDDAIGDGALEWLGL